MGDGEDEGERAEYGSAHMCVCMCVRGRGRACVLVSQRRGC